MVAVGLLAGYLTVEVLDVIIRAPLRLPLSALLMSRLRFSEGAASGLLAGTLVLTVGIYVYWTWKYTTSIPKRTTAGTVERTPKVEGRTPVGISGGIAELVEKDLLAVKTSPSQIQHSQQQGTPPTTPHQLLQREESRPGNEGPTPFQDIFPIEGYPLNVYAAIKKEEGQEIYRYEVIEPTLDTEEKSSMEDLKNLLIEELDVDLRSIENKADAEKYLSKKVTELASRYGYKLPSASMAKFLYYLTRDFIRLGKIDPLMRDKLIEDISCDGAKIPIYVWYRDYESIPSNILFETDAELDTYVSKLAYAAGKHISLAEPIVDASLSDGSRIHLTYGREVTQRGSTFTIRKFRTDPLTIVDLIKYNTMSSDVAAYLWYLIEKKLALLVAGGTASGKTTSLNALSMFIEPGQKIISVEDTPELNLPHENWIQSVTRGVGTAGEITMFDLLKASLRQRPDVIIVGEVRGEEAFTLLQSIATGHGGLGTIHADSVEAVINRLTTEPMNIPRSLLGTTLDCIAMQLKIKLTDKSIRRVVNVAEVVGHDPRSDQIILNDAFKWDPATDRFIFSGRSRLFDKVAQRYGTRPDEMKRDVDGRKAFLDWLASKNIRSYEEVSEKVREFYGGPNAMINRAKTELEKRTS